LHAVPIIAERSIIMLELITKNWWTFTLRGIVAILFGIMALAWPGLTLTLLIIMFATYAIIDGVFAIAAAISGAAPHGQWWVLVLWGVLGIAAGVVAFFYPGATAIVLLYVIAFWAIVRGVMEIVAAIQMRKVINNEWLLIIAGICSVIFGGILLARPGVGAIALLWFIGLASIIVGILLISLSVRLKSLKDRITTMHRPAAV
jgi:uncharacterized membrane protein HdeD (DUF308 family)